MSTAEVLDREAMIPEEYKDIVLYDDYGNRVTNIRTLRSIKQGLKIAEEWRREMESFDWGDEDDNDEEDQ